MVTHLKQLSVVSGHTEFCQATPAFVATPIAATNASINQSMRHFEGACRDLQNYGFSADLRTRPFSILEQQSHFEMHIDVF